MRSSVDSGNFSLKQAKRHKTKLKKLAFMCKKTSTKNQNKVTFLLIIKSETFVVIKVKITKNTSINLKQN